jgi:hypothetical protein
MTTNYTDDSEIDFFQHFCDDGKTYKLMYVRSNADGEYYAYKSHEYWENLYKEFPLTDDLSADEEAEKYVLYREICRMKIYSDKLEKGEIDNVSSIYPYVEYDEKKIDDDDLIRKYETHFDSYDEFNEYYSRHYDEDGNEILDEEFYIGEDIDDQLYYKPSRTYGVS